MSELTEITAVRQELTALRQEVAQLTAALDAVKELYEDIVPIANGFHAVVSRKLEQLEQSGVLGFAAESLKVGERIATSFTREDVRLLGDNVVTILKTVRSLTQPEVLELAERAASALRTADEAHRASPGLIRSLGNPQVRRGAQVLVDVLRALGDTNGNNKTEKQS